MIAAIITVIVVLLAIGVALAGASVRVLREYERAVIFRLGRVIEKKGPGLIFLTPAVDRMVRVSLRTVTLNVPPQDVITRDNVPVRVDAVVYFRVVDPDNAVVFDWDPDVPAGSPHGFGPRGTDERLPW